MPFLLVGRIWNMADSGHDNWCPPTLHGSCIQTCNALYQRRVDGKITTSPQGSVTLVDDFIAKAGGVSIDEQTKYKGL